MEQISNDVPSNDDTNEEDYKGRAILPNEHVTIEEIKISIEHDHKNFVEEI